MGPPIGYTWVVMHQMKHPTPYPEVALALDLIIILIIGVLFWSRKQS